MTVLNRKKSLQRAKENQLTIVFKLQVTQHEFTFVRKNAEQTKVIERTNKKKLFVTKQNCIPWQPQIVQVQAKQDVLA